jgi:uncharacterized protein YjbJ (UPF0337 family)
MSNASNRADGTTKEIGGKIKAGVAKLIGDDQMEADGEAKAAEGKAQKEAAKAAERGKGKIEEVVGAVKNRVGNLVGADQAAAKGRVEELKGQARQKANK